MKRSEAVQRIKEIHNRIFTIQMCDAFDEDELCEMFLDRIEVELGMLPPKIRRNLTQEEADRLSNEWSEFSTDDVKSEHSWDEE